MDLMQAYEQLGHRAKRVGSKHGGEFAGKCPVCGGTDRFRFWPGQEGCGRYWCRQCLVEGDIVQFLRDFQGLSFRDAAQAAGRGHIIKDGPRGPRVPRQATPPRRYDPEQRVFSPHGFVPPCQQWQDRARAFAAWAHKRLLEQPEVLDYLAGRGISQETAIKFGLGYNPETMYRSRTSWGLAPEKRTNVRDKPLWLPAGIVIPYESDGVMHRVRIRQDNPAGNSGKYIVVAGGSGAPMLINPHARAYIVVEAELDSMAIDEAAGDLVGVLALGTVSIGPDPAQHVMLQQALAILVALDCEADQRQAGAQAVRNAAGKWEATYPRAELTPVPVGKDPGDYYQAGGDLREWVLACLPPALQPVERPASAVACAPNPNPKPKPEPAAEPPARQPIGPDGVVYWADGTWSTGVLRDMCRGMQRAELVAAPSRDLAQLADAIQERNWVLLTGRAKAGGELGPALVLGDDEDAYQRGRAEYLWTRTREIIAKHVREVRR